MKRIVLKMLFITATSFLLTSCATFTSLNTNTLKIGMSKEEAQKAIGRKPGGVVASKRLPGSNKIVEVLQFTDTMQAYWLYFIDGTLDRWEPTNVAGPAI
ncbi:hypothetical protein [Mucilaginibacter sp. CSA2-8R]|uniref:hypothetical protein n=1 Tax=Mucilaginibacter sp. CSA2-8R TaxID=3141542 RepID=UPI00315D6700